MVDSLRDDDLVCHHLLYFVSITSSFLSTTQSASLAVNNNSTWRVAKEFHMFNAVLFHEIILPYRSSNDIDENSNEQDKLEIIFAR